MRYPDASLHVVVAGGKGDASSVVLDLDRMLWLPGPSLPTDVHWGASVPFQVRRSL